MERFRIRKGRGKALVGSVILPAVITSVVALVFVLFYPPLSRDADIEGTTLVVTVAITIAVMSIFFFAGFKRQERIFESYSVSIDESSITREQLSTSPLTIRRSEVRKIIRASNVTISVWGGSAFNVIVIPAGMENGERLLSLLREIAPVSEYTKHAWLYRYRLLFVMLPLGLMVVL